ncbi:hypothetical protein [Reinekea thalattae]|uniref:Uncharacterized protein n=1 Tax=Reinekea thalattae TaxID=2593301 RepID=A0A5C8Z291_9GAMM|nr:hypothetical protein [Reinekea thalattae]TXR51369.1 hypothetical protein FME95_12630 [Reinekea thalattae]
MKILIRSFAVTLLALSLGFATAADNDRPRPPGPDFAEIATSLGIAEQDLIDALGQPEPGQHPDLAVAAEKLGLSEQDLMDAMGPPPGEGARPSH